VAASGVTGILALLIIGAFVAAGSLLGAVAALGGALPPATLTVGAVLGGRCPVSDSSVTG
jgi:hypothetical protein